MNRLRCFYAPSMPHEPILKIENIIAYFLLYSNSYKLVSVPWHEHLAYCCGLCLHTTDRSKLTSSAFAAHYIIGYKFCCNFQRPVKRNNSYRLTLKLNPVRVALKNINIIGIFFSAPLYEFADQRGSLYLNTLKSRPLFEIQIFSVKVSMLEIDNLANTKWHEVKKNP